MSLQDEMFHSVAIRYKYSIQNQQSGVTYLGGWET